MDCPYCNVKMTKYAEDSWYDYFRCKNRECESAYKEFMQLKERPIGEVGLGELTE